ncbi:MAG: hypothetical protein ACQESR_26755 [Planctomycetota bacterium]
MTQTVLPLVGFPAENFIADRYIEEMYRIRFAWIQNHQAIAHAGAAR